MNQSKGKVANRREKIVRLVSQGISRVDELADRLNVSPVTVRRDLAWLEKANKLSRTYGGAAGAAQFTERHLQERMSSELPSKQAIGEAALQFVPAESVIFVDAGSTCAALISQLPAHAKLTIVTRSPEIAIMAAGLPKVKTIITGGVVAPLSHGLVGCLVSNVMSSFRFDVAFLGVDAAHPVDGIGEPTLEEAATKQLAAARAGRVVVLADHTKLHTSSVHAWTQLSDWTLITDELADSEDCEADLDAFRKAGIEVVVAPFDYRS